jgi:AGZA family xanthine/uracil permease-like MFS transporter
MAATATPTAGPPVLWSRGELNAAFGFGINMLVNVLVLAGLAAGVVQIPGADVYGTILPALGIELLVGNVFYFWLARRLAIKSGRTDVTAMPYGPSVPHMFIVTFVVMLPTFLATKDPIAAWSAGLAWAFIIGIIILIGAFVGPYVAKYTPRAALLGTLAGISLTFIAMSPAAQMWNTLWVSLPVFGILLIGFVGGVKMPGNFPVGLFALLVGSAIAWAGGFMETAAVGDAAKSIAVGLPSLNFDLLFDGLKDISPLLATAIPLGIYNFTEAMSNVESAKAAGDDYNLRAVLLADGSGAVVGSCLGCPFPPAVYVGQPGWKQAGGRISYSLATGIAIFLFCAFGLFPLMAAILPVPAIVPVLLYIGLVIGAQSFKEVPKAHYAAVVLATIPNIAAWGSGQINNALAAAGTSADKVGDAAFANAGVVYGGLMQLGEGAVLAGLLLGAIAAFLIDKKFLWAAGYAVAAAALSLIGLIHGEKVEFFADWHIPLGYLLLAGVFVGAHFLGEPEREPDPTDPVDMADAAAAAAAKGTAAGVSAGAPATVGASNGATADKPPLVTT